MFSSKFLKQPNFDKTPWFFGENGLKFYYRIYYTFEIVRFKL